MELEDFSEISNKSIWALLRNFIAIVDVLKSELPVDYMTPSWHIADGTDNFTVGISARWGKNHYFLTVYTHYLAAPPEPKEMYPPNCCAIGDLQISSSETLEVCATPECWMAHDNDKWVPLSAPYIAFLLGKTQKPLSAS